MSDDQTCPLNPTTLAQRKIARKIIVTMGRMINPSFELDAETWDTNDPETYCDVKRMLLMGESGNYE